MADQTLQCADCGVEFLYTEADQQFYAEKGFSPPRRCRTCRAAAKAARGQGGPRPGGFGGGAGAGTRTREMHDATCASCGVTTQVPFKPTGSRPVYCRNCFQR
ncbi:MAG: CxxC-x17-CxxC domain-containing protein [Candidatus Sericytochromatia bacterium]|nr:CxxC-x17-CxxC domain-containing protein [Candidatus Sericytochromatia bacterium]